MFFITIGCGAVSGFHSLVASRTTAEPGKYLLASIAIILIALALFILVQSIRVVRRKATA
ncbi:MAG: carbon starvation CstA family protein [Candidatus Chlorobium antarcticum]|nr:carbon starvation CstA family protein [Candidatus Chlorobium antarcticum]